MKKIMVVAVCGLLMAACGAKGPQEGFVPVDSGAAVFWDRQSTETAELMQQVAADFNGGWKGGLPLKVERAGGYDDIFRKVTASIHAHVLPSMAVCYENMTSQYIPTGAVLPLDDLINNPKEGFSKEDLDDFFPAVLESNRFSEFGGKTYSFPFTKSVLVMYFNKAVLAQAGFDHPPVTWEEFLEQCRAVKAKTGKFAYAINPDCSTIDAMIFSRGGEVYADGKLLFDSPEAISVFSLYEAIAKEGLGYQISGTYDDEVAFAKDEVAFTFRTASGRIHVAALMHDRMEQWGLTRIPQADPDHPKTVLYGGNICLFDTTPEQSRTAWAFVKYFTSKECMARWAVNTGYVPFRKSVADEPAVQQFWAQWTYNRTGFDCLAFARPEPNIGGWQEIRELAAKSLCNVLNGRQTGPEAARALQQQAEAVLKR